MQSHPKPEYTVLKFPDTDDLFFVNYVIQVPSKQLERGVAVEDMAHEPCEFVSGDLKRAQVW